jgi:hypothetical protein
MGSTDSFFNSAAGTVSVDSATPAHGGTYSLKANPSASTAYVYSFAAAPGTMSVYHFAIRLNSLPSADVTDLGGVGITTANSVRMFLGYQQSTNKFMARIRNSNGVFSSWQVANMNPIVAGQWYAIDMKYDTSSSSTWTANWAVDGVANSPALTVGTLASSTANYYIFVGNYEGAATYWANYDEVTYSQTAADYPLPDGTVKILLPDGNSTDNLAAVITNETGGTGDRSTWYQKVDEVPPTSTDYIKQATVNAGAYAGFTFQDPPAGDTCIKAVAPNLFSTGMGATKPNTAGFHVMDGATDDTAWNYNLGPNFANGSITGLGNFINPTGTNWTNAEVAGLIGRVGYASSIPNSGAYARWDQISLQYLNAPVTGGGTPGSETGQTTSVVTATGSPACGSPAQVDSRACSYAAESYTATPGAVISTTLDLSGSGAGTCQLYQYTPNTSAGTTSVYADRGLGSGTDGVISESVTRYGGSFVFGQLCSTASTTPTGWQGYYVKYDTGAGADTAFASAGQGTTGPSTSQAGAISVYNGSGYTTVIVTPSTGAWSAQPATVTAFSSGGYKYDLTASLSSVPSYTTQTPTGAVGTADRTSARAVLGSPVVGTITYKVTNASTSAVVTDLTMTIDLGTLTAYARYAP